MQGCAVVLPSLTGRSIGAPLFDGNEDCAALVLLVGVRLGRGTTAGDSLGHDDGSWWSDDICTVVLGWPGWHQLELVQGFFGRVAGTIAAVYWHRISHVQRCSSGAPRSILRVVALVLLAVAHLGIGAPSSTVTKTATPLSLWECAWVLLTQLAAPIDRTHFTTRMPASRTHSDLGWRCSLSPFHIYSPQHVTRRRL